MRNKRAVSAIVAAILIVLVTVVAVVLILSTVMPVVKEGLEFSDKCLAADVSIDNSGFSCYDSVEEVVAVRVVSGVVEDVLGVQVIGYFGGNTEKTEEYIFGSNSAYIYYFNTSSYGRPEVVKVAPIVMIGSELTVCDVSSSVEPRDCDINLSNKSVRGFGNVISGGGGGGSGDDGSGDDGSGDGEEPPVELPVLVPAGANSYVILEISETKIGDEVEFELLSQENVWGNYGGLVSEYDEELGYDYVLAVHTSWIYRLFGNERRYGVSSSRFVYYDDFGNSEEPGGVEEFDSGVIRAVIPYVSSIDGVKINGVDLGVDLESIEEVKTCKDEGEEGNYSLGESCCLDFVPMSVEGFGFVCSDCGDGDCNGGDGETRFSCPEDCSEE